MFANPMNWMGSGKSKSQKDLLRGIGVNLGQGGARRSFDDISKVGIRGEAIFDEENGEFGGSKEDGNYTSSFSRLSFSSRNSTPNAADSKNSSTRSRANSNSSASKRTPSTSPAMAKEVVPPPSFWDYTQDSKAEQPQENTTNSESYDYYEQYGHYEHHENHQNYDHYESYDQTNAEQPETWSCEIGGNSTAGSNEYKNDDYYNSEGHEKESYQYSESQHDYYHDKENVNTQLRSPMEPQSKASSASKSPLQAKVLHSTEKFDVDTYNSGDNDEEQIEILFSKLRHNRAAYVKDALRAGFDVNTVDTKGNSLLHICAQNDNKKMAAMMIKLGCRVNIANKKGLTALDYARTYKFLQLEQLLLEAGAELGKRRVVLGDSRF
jgi:hypothetical protein